MLVQRCCQCHDADFHGFAAVCAKLRTFMLMDHLQYWTKNCICGWQQTSWFLIQFFFDGSGELFWNLSISAFAWVIHQPLISPAVWDALVLVYRKRVRCASAQETWLTKIDKHKILRCFHSTHLRSAQVPKWKCQIEPAGEVRSPPPIWVVVVEGNYPSSSWILNYLESYISFDQSWFHVRHDFPIWPNTFAASIWGLWAVRQNGCEPWRSQRCLPGMSCRRCHWS